MIQSQGVTVRRGYVDGRYGQVHYRTNGPVRDSGRPPLVLLHQNPSSSLEYTRLITAIGEDRLVIALDTPGYGMSDAPPAPLSMADYSACLGEALEGLLSDDDGPVDLYGFHTGTLLAIEIALAIPQRVRRLALSGIPFHTPEERATRLSAAQAGVDLDEAGDVAVDLARRLWDYVVAARDPRAELAEAATMWMEKLRPLDRQSWAYVGVWSYAYEDRLPLLTHPVLLLQPDEIIAPQSIAAAALMPNARVERLDGFPRDIFHIPEGITALADALRHYFDNPLISGA